MIRFEQYPVFGRLCLKANVYRIFDRGIKSYPEAKIVSPAPNLWLSYPELNAHQDSLEVVIGLGDRGIESYVSAEVSVRVDAPYLAWPIAVSTIGTSSESWNVFSNTADGPGSAVIVAMAGPSPLEENKSFLRIIFSTGLMNPGDTQPFSVTVRLNESSYQLLEGVIWFSVLPGDVNLSGQLTALDAALILHWLVGHVTLGSDALSSADVSGNGEVTAYDAALILQYLVGSGRFRNNFPVQEKAEILVVSSMQPSMAGGGGSAAAGKIVASQPTITIGKERITPDGNYTVPILIDRMSGVISGEFEIGPVNTPVEVAAGEIIKGATFLSHRDGDRVKIAFAGDGNNQSSDGGELFSLKFSSKPTAVIRMKARVNENPSQMISTSVQQKTWGEIKAGFMK